MFILLLETYASFQTAICLFSDLPPEKIPSLVFVPTLKPIFE
jgi:hypothetical protein